MNKEEIRKQNIENYNFYGLNSQKDIWIEEMSELTKELCKWARNDYKCNTTNLKEEFVDVIICLEQLKYALDMTDDEIIDRYVYKVERQAQRNRELKEKVNTKNDYFQTIIDLGYDYDGCSNSNELKELIDELVYLAKEGRKADK